ncbi:transposase, partial [Kingella kingae]|uniref:transposase n=1 Tax=Kingella kingae TaxID=504 RepID=UPI003D6EF3F3
MTRKSYPTDLTDAQCQAIEPYFNQLRHYKWDKRQLVNAVLYMTKTGCQWRMLPNDFPPYS